jgi:hypothetical protein
MIEGVDTADRHLRSGNPGLPSLSFQRQPSLQEFVHILTETDGDITIFCGAGASIDSGLPTWVGLIKELAKRLSNEALREIILAEEADLTRRVQMLLAAIETELRPEHLIADALYSPVSAQPPGLLLSSVAKLASLLGKRVRLITTNYDDRLELALEGLAIPGATVAASGLADAGSWWNSDNPFEVLHLHGFLPSKKSAPRFEIKLPIVLGEDEYLHYGAQVQNVISRCITESTVLFVGASMTDPSLVFPLHQANTAKTITTPFALLVPDESAAAKYSPQDAEMNAESFLSLVRSHLQTALGTRTIALKSYGQVAQCVAEFCAALQAPGPYVDSDPRTSHRYGHRYKRILGRVHEHLGVTEGMFAASDDASRDVSDRLHSALVSPEGPVGNLLDFRQVALPMLEPRGLESHYFEGEQWALFLWLRTLKAEPDYSRYEIFQAGTSAYTRRDGRTMIQRSVISPRSRFAAARALYIGQVQTETIPDPKIPTNSPQDQPWLTFSALPLSVSEETVGLEPTGTNTNVTIGAIVLHTNRKLVEIADGASLSALPKSISLMSFMTAEERSALHTATLLAGMSVVASS